MQINHLLMAKHFLINEFADNQFDPKWPEYKLCIVIISYLKKYKTRSKPSKTG